MPKIPENATHKITKATFDRVDVVPAGANSAADIVLFKAKKDEGGHKMPKAYEEILKSLPEEEQAVITAEIQKERELAKSEANEIKEQQELEKQKEANLTEDELILKSLDGPAKEAFEKIIKERKEAQAAAAQAEEEKFAKQMDDELEEVAFVKSKEGFEDNYKKLAKENPELKEAVLDILKQVDKVIEDSDFFKEVGSSAEGNEDASTELERLAKERAEANKISFEKAYTQVLKERPDLYQE